MDMILKEMTMSNPWEQIKTPLANFNVRRADYEHSFDFFWAKDVSGDYLFLFQCDADISFPNDVPKLAGIDILFPASVSDNKTTLILRLKNREDWDIFYSLCIDLIQATSICAIEESVVAVIVSRLERWHIFLKKNRGRIMSEAEQKGLIGELLFLRDHLLTRFSVSESISFWQGPLDAPQDFCICDSAVEVKCQLGTSKPLIRITSIDQLNTQLSRLYLFVVTLGRAAEKSENVINLPIIIGEIRNFIQINHPSSGDLFEDLLLQAGYMDMKEYEEHHYILSRFRFYEVRDGFPRLYPDDIPDGIINVTMEIMLERCSEFVIDPDSVKIM